MGVLGVAVLFGFDASSLSVFSSAGAAGKVPIPALVSNALALLAVVFLGWILYHNSVNGAVDPGEKCENSDQSDGSVNDTISDSSVASTCTFVFCFLGSRRRDALQRRGQPHRSGLPTARALVGFTLCQASGCRRVCNAHRQAGRS